MFAAMRAGMKGRTAHHTPSRTFLHYLADASGSPVDQKRSTGAGCDDEAEESNR
jgi:hypothetical protein